MSGTVVKLNDPIRLQQGVGTIAVHYAGCICRFFPDSKDPRTVHCLVTAALSAQLDNDTDIMGGQNISLVMLKLVSVGF